MPEGLELGVGFLKGLGDDEYIEFMSDVMAEILNPLSE
jgi:hypothetical protein